MHHQKLVSGTAALRRAVAAAVESLECRRLFTTIVVTSLADNTVADGTVTLREAIQAAETDTSVDGSAAGFGADTIAFAPSLTAGGDATITLTQFNTGLEPLEFGPTAFDLSTDVTIQGPTGNNGITIQRDSADTDAFRLFRVRTGASLTLNDVNVGGGLAQGGNGSGGGAGLGGGIFNQGTLRLDHSTLFGNAAVGGNGSLSGGGGGVGSSTDGSTGGGPNGGAASIGTNDGGNGGFGGGGGSGEPGPFSAFNGGAGGFGGGGGAGAPNTGFDDGGTGGAGGFGGGGGGGGSGADAGGTGGAAGFGGGAGDAGITTVLAPPGMNGTGAGGGGAGMGGAIFNEAGSVTLIDSTLSGNTVTGGSGGGGAATGGSAYGAALFNHNGTGQILSSTIVGNRANAAPGGDARGSVYVRHDGGTISPVVISNSILAVSSVTGVAAPPDKDLSTSGGIGLVIGTNNLIQSPTGLVTNFVTQTADPQLSALSDNGGPTLTHLPANTSPVVNGGDNAAASAISTDQRGDARIAGGLVDIGSVETSVQPASSFSIANVSSPEGNSGSTPFNFIVTRSGDLSAPASVGYQTTPGSATAGTDYTSTSGTLNFIANQATATIQVAVSGDTTVESNETFTVTLGNATANASITTATATGTIVNDDAPAELSINDVTLDEGNAGAQMFNFTVTRTGDLSGQASVGFSTADGSATTAGGDYQAKSGTVSFLADQATATISIAVNGDVMFEPNETFTVNLAGPTGATISDGSGMGTITNDDAAPLGNVSVNDVATAEGDAGLTPLVFTVTRSGDASLAASVDYFTSNGTAIAGLDYQPVSGTLNFLPNQLTKIVTVQVIGDKDVESNEQFFLNLAAPGNVTIVDAQGIGTIANDDIAPPPLPPATAVLGTDPASPSKVALLVTGTDAGETIEIDPGSSSSKLIVLINNVQVGPQFSTSAFGRIVIDAKGGNDHIDVTSKTTKDTLILGGAGQDSIKGGNGNDVIVGGADNDILSGRKGRDLLIGGSGADGITGDEDDDLIIAAATTYDADLNSLAAFEKEWTSSNSYSKRVDDIRNGKGSNVGGRAFNNASIIEDSAFDQLSGNGNSDLFFYFKGSNDGTVKDKLIDKSSSETAVDSN